MKIIKAIEDNNLEKVKELLSTGINIDQPDKEGMTPLMWAAQTQSPTIIKLLLELGADPKLKDNKGFNALNIACWYGEQSMGAYTRECKRIIDIFKEVGLRL